jgi:hypothetical protein
MLVMASLKIIEHAILLLLVHKVVIVKALEVLVVTHLSGCIHQWRVHEEHLRGHVMLSLHSAHLSHLSNEIALVETTQVHHISELVVLIFRHLHVVAHINIVHRGVGVVHHQVVLGHPLLRACLVHLVHVSGSMALIHTHVVHRRQKRICVHHSVR